MRILARYAAPAAIAALFLSGTSYAAEDVRVSPHSDAGDCALCHVASAEKLRGWFVLGSTKRELKDDLNETCQKCHSVKLTRDEDSMAVGVGHATGKKPAVNHQNLPLASDGTITCATTCHNIHVTSNNPHQQLKHLRVPANALCLSCHDT